MNRKVVDVLVLALLVLAIGTLVLASIRPSPGETVARSVYS